MNLTHDQRVLLRREAELIREAYENDSLGDGKNRAILKARYEEIDRMLRCDGEHTNQTLLQH